MRVIAGEYRRRTLVAPRGIDTRPTSDRLRETLFNVLGQRISRASFLDLYAGSGANGIEALSRGAARVVFVEQAAPALAAIRENLAALGIVSACTVDARPVAAWLRAAVAKSAARFDIVFLDPPYAAAQEYAATLGAFGGEAQMLLAPGAIVVAEHRRSRRATDTHAPVERYGALVRTRVLEHGDAALTFYLSEKA